VIHDKQTVWTEDKKQDLKSSFQHVVHVERINRLEVALQNTLSKLESQVCRNPNLPESYRQCVTEGFRVLNA